MGIPKFFRWLSERYPLINQMLEPTEVLPEVDNLYLDMNGIIHHCTHPNNEDSLTFRLTEKEMFISIFQYVDKLIHLIKPKKLFYLAVDGVAPRAKLNQQRQRRFRTAKEATEALAKAKAEGLQIADKPFDSNVITPGTDFMKTLSAHLKFYIRKKIQEDQTWKNVTVIFSGQEEPGEGEHKIMEYIRKQKSQDSWDANTKHCLYGLDADLIMLSLTTHEPHFILLREEVLKNKNAKKESDRFHLLHISLLREYLQLEFKNLPGFNADIERVIDDFVLMCFFVGNDFLPNLPNQDIADGALNTFLELYKKLLPRWKNYLTNKSTINLGLLEELLCNISKGERDYYDLPVASHMGKSLHITSDNNNFSKNSSGGGHLSSSDEFLGLQDSNNSLSDSGENHQNRRKKFINDMLRVGIDVKQEEDEMDKLREDDQSWKDIYYKDKFQVTIKEIEYISKLTTTYIEGLTWVLNYYHNGCISWGWFYPYHYAPLASDLKQLNRMNITFELGQPFFPYQQLLAVLPRESCKFLPLPYQELMNNPNSPIIDFYPSDIQLDMNGKKNSWESIVLIPFIDQKRLVDAINKIDINRLTKEEISKNQFGPSYIYYFDPKNSENVQTTFPGLFENIQGCNVVEKVYTLPPYPTGKHEGFKVCNGVLTGIESPNGFPSLYHLKFSSLLKPIHINVFGSNSRKESLLITLDNSICINEDHDLLIKQFKSLIGTTCYVNYPYLKEGIISSISDNRSHYYSDKEYAWSKIERENWSKEAAFAYNKSFGTKAIDMGETSIVFHVKLLNNLVEHLDGSVTKQYAHNESLFAYQTIVFKVPRPDERYQERQALPITQLYPLGEKVIYVGKDAYVKGIPVMQYGSLSTIVAHEPSGTISIDIFVGPRPPAFGQKIAQSSQDPYYSMYSVAKSLGISTRALSKITGTVTFEPGRQNVGLSMKFSSRNEQVLGYTRKLDQDNNNLSSSNNRGPQWEFSQKAIDVIAEYLNKFPRIFELLEEKPEASTYQIDELEIEEEIDITTIKPLKTSTSSKISTLTDSVGTSPDKEIETDEEESDEEFDNLPMEEEGASQRTKNIRYLKNVKEWLRTLEIRNLPRVPCGSRTISPDGIKKIEESSNSFVEYSKQQTTKRTITGVKPSLLLAPLPSIPDNLSSFIELGDRVLIASRQTSIPFGSHATVVAIKGNYVDLVLDLPSIAATSLGKKCSELRGATLPKSSLLNLSNPANERPVRQQQQQQRQDNRERYDNRQDNRERHDNRQYNNNNDNRGGGRNNRGPLNKSDSELKNVQDNRDRERDRGYNNNNRQQKGYSNSKSSDSIGESSSTTPQYKPKQNQGGNTPTNVPSPTPTPPPTNNVPQKQTFITPNQPPVTQTVPTTTTTTTIPNNTTTTTTAAFPPSFYQPTTTTQQTTATTNLLGLNMGVPLNNSGTNTMDPQVLLAQQSLALQQQILMQMQLQQQQQMMASGMYPTYPSYPAVPTTVYNPNTASIVPPTSTTVPTSSTEPQMSSYPTNKQVRHAQPLNWQQQQQLNEIEEADDFSVNSGGPNNNRRNKPRHRHHNNNNNANNNYRNNNNQQQQQQYEQREDNNNYHNNRRNNNNNSNRRDNYNKSASTWAPKKSSQNE